MAAQAGVDDMDEDKRFGTDSSLQDEEWGSPAPEVTLPEETVTPPEHAEDMQPAGSFSGGDAPAQDGPSMDPADSAQGEAPEPFQSGSPQQESSQGEIPQPEHFQSGTPQPEPSEYEPPQYEMPQPETSGQESGQPSFGQPQESPADAPHDFDDDEPRFDTQTGEPLNKPKKKYPGILLTFAVTAVAVGAFIYSVMPGKLPSAGIPADDEVEAETEAAEYSTETEEALAPAAVQTETEAETEALTETEPAAQTEEMPVFDVPEFKTEGVALSAGTDLADLVEAVMPGIVSVTGAGKETVTDIMLGERDPEGTDAGSGVIVYMDDEACYIVTDLFIVEQAEQVTVGFSVRMDGTEQLPDEDTLAQAEVIGTDPESDLALVYVRKEDINGPVLEEIGPSVMGDSDKLRVGQRTIAVGNAAGRGLSATEGILSAMGRERSERTGVNRVYLWTDASINSGNYGGALVNGSGEVIGINAAGVSKQSGDGIGYAVPVNDMVEAIARMAGNGAGETAEEPEEAAEPEETAETEETAVQDETEAQPGRIGLAIADDSDEEEAGEEKPQTEPADQEADEEKPQTEAAAGEEQIAEIRETEPAPGETEAEAAGSGGKLGIQAVEITPESRIINRIPEGVYIMEVSAGSGAAAAGLRQGDVIVAVNDAAVASITDLTGILGSTKPGDKVKVFYIRPDGNGEYNSRQEKSVVVTLQ